MNKAAMPPKYLAVMPVARVVENWMCTDVAIIVGEYARATDEEIVCHLDLSGDYTYNRSSMSEKHDEKIECTIMKRYPGQDPTYTTHCIITGERYDILKPSYRIRFSIDTHMFDEFSIGEREMCLDIHQTVMHKYFGSYLLPVVRILNARIGEAAKDYVL